MTDAVWEAWGSALTAIRDERADPQNTLVAAANVIRNILGLPAPPSDDADGA